MFREIPPTAGMPLELLDLVPRAGDSTLADGLAAFIGVPSVQLECSGTAAFVLVLSYLKSKCKKSDHQQPVVVLPAYTCPLVAIAAAQAGLKVELCPSVDDGYDFDLEYLEEICRERAPIAVVPTHFGGLPAANIHEVVAIARKYGVTVVEDAAQSLGATLHGQSIGTFGDIGIFSLSCGKGLTIYQGGFWHATNGDTTAEILAHRKSLIENNFLMECLRSAELIGYALAYNPIVLHYIYGNPLRHWLRRGDAARAVGDIFPLRTEICEVGKYRQAVGVSALKRLPSHVQSCRQRGRQRSSHLNETGPARILQEPIGGEGSWPFLTVVFNKKDECDRVLNKLWPVGFGITKLFATSLFEYDYLRTIVRSDSPTPSARKFAQRTMTITNSHWLSDEDFMIISESISTTAMANKNGSEPLLRLR